MADINPNEAITRGGVKSLVDEVIEKLTTKFMILASGVLIVLGIGFITLLITVAGLVIDAYRFRAATYEDLKNQVVSQNQKIDALAKALQASTTPQTR